MNKILFSLSALIVSFVALIFAVNVLATQPETVTICHAAGQEDTLQFVTLTLPYNAVYGQAGHFSEPGTPNAGHENDYEGPCEEETTPTPTPTPGEEEHYACVRNTCVLVEGAGDNTCETNSDCEETTPTPTPTETPGNPGGGGPGDGLSDNLGCSTRDCSGNQKQPTQAVLGLSTTSGEENYLLQLTQLFGALTSAGLGLAFFKK